MCRPVLQILTLFQTKKCHFLTRFHVIITWIRTLNKKKRFLKIHLELINDKYVHKLQYFPRKPYQTKMGTVYTRVQIKHHTLWGVTYLYVFKKVALLTFLWSNPFCQIVHSFGLVLRALLVNIMSLWAIFKDYWCLVSSVLIKDRSEIFSNNSEGINTCMVEADKAKLPFCCFDEKSSLTFYLYLDCYDWRCNLLNGSINVDRVYFRYNVTQFILMPKSYSYAARKCCIIC